MVKTGDSVMMMMIFGLKLYKVVVLIVEVQ